MLVLFQWFLTSENDYKRKKKLPSIYGPRHIKLLPKKNGISISQ